MCVNRVSLLKAYPVFLCVIDFIKKYCIFMQTSVQIPDFEISLHQNAIFRYFTLRFYSFFVLTFIEKLSIISK